MTRVCPMRRGVTLVETAIAGAIAALSILALMRALSSMRLMARDTSLTLAASAYAWDVAWRCLNCDGERLAATEGAWRTIPEGDCPVLEATAADGSVPEVFVRVEDHDGIADGAFAVWHGELPGKLVAVNVRWGSGAAARALNALGADGRRTLGVEVAVVKSSTPRWTEVR